ncbi:MAG: carbohydrate binding domain-containing protein, partial [Lentisphaeraceae bacterium]|nr:carbohydrate binding domain-containing protein [Lentisphaeraceae bacterium]
VDGIYTHTFTDLADGTYNFMVRLIDAGDPIDRSLYSEIVTVKIGEGGEDPNLISNGNFSQNLEDWDATVKEAVASLAVVDGLFIADIEQPPAKNWQVNLKQSNISLQSGASYTLSFDAVATKADGQTSIARKVAFRIKDSNDNKILWKAFTIDSSELASYQHTFTNELGSSNNCELMIFMGYEDNPNVLYLDNIELIAN